MDRVEALVAAREPLAAPGGGFEAGQRRALERAALGVPDVVGAGAERAPSPAIDDVEVERVVDAEVGVEAVRRGPGPEANPGDPQVLVLGRAQGQDLAVDQHGVALGHEPARAQLDALDRGVDIARGPAPARLLAQHVPRLDRVAQFELDVAGLQLPDQRTAQFDEGPKKLGVHAQFMGLEECQHVLEVLPHPIGQQEFVVEARAPANQALSVGPLGQRRQQAAHQQHLGDGHARVRGHLDRPEFDQALPAHGRPPVEQFVDRQFGSVTVAGHVDQEIAKEHVAQPGRAGLPGLAKRVGEGDLDLVQLVVTGFVDPGRLRGRPDEEAREHVAERGVMLQKGDQAGEQLGPVHEGALERRGTAEGQVMTAARAGLAPVEQVLFGVQARVQTRVVDGLHQLDVALAGLAGRDVDLEHAGVGRDGDLGQHAARRGRVALEHDRQLQLAADAIEDRNQIDEVVLALERGQEHVERTLVVVKVRAPLDAERGVSRVLAARLGQLADPTQLLAARERFVFGDLAAGILGRERGLGLRDRQGHALDRVERQAQADRAVAGQQEQVVATEAPRVRNPTLALAAKRQDPADDAAEALIEHPTQPRSGLAVGEIEVERIEVLGDPSLLAHEVPGVFVGRLEVRGQPERLGQRLGQPLGVGSLRSSPALAAFAALPDRPLVDPTDRVEGPTRHALARVVLAHPMQEHAARMQTLAQLRGQSQATGPLVGPERAGVPLGQLGVLARVEGRLAAHGHAHAEGRELGVGAPTRLAQASPDLVGVGRRRARLVTEARDRHAKVDLLGGHLGAAVERRGQGRRRRAGERDVALGRHQARGRVEADPAGTRNIGLGPGVEIDDVVIEALGQIGQHAFVGDLDQVAADEAGRDPASTQERDQEHGRVATAAAALRERLFGRPHAGLFADHVVDAPVDQRVHLDDRVDRSALVRHLGQEGLELLAAGERGIVEAQEGRELERVLGRVGEAELLDPMIDEEVEGVDRANLDDQLDQDVELAEALVPGKRDPRDLVAVGIDRPLDPLGLLAAEVIGLDMRLGVAGRVKAQRVSPERHRLGVHVVASMLNEQAHAGRLTQLIGPPRRVARRCNCDQHDRVRLARLRA